MKNSTHYWQGWQLIPAERLAELLRAVCGVDLATATSAARGHKKAEELAGLAKHIGEQVKQAPVNHLDETGYRSAGVRQWRHGASTWLLTFYRPSRQRGALREGVRGISVHDFWRPYFTLAGPRHALCHAQHWRELQALSESEKEPWARALSRFLRHACPAATLARRRNRGLKPGFLGWLSARYDRLLAHGMACHES